MSVASVSVSMDEIKKEKGDLVLKRLGTNATACINELYDEIIEKNSIPWKRNVESAETLTSKEITDAIVFLDNIPTIDLQPEYKNITAKEARKMRLAEEVKK